MIELFVQLIIALQVANITATFGVLLTVGSFKERLKNLEREVFR